MRKSFLIVALGVLSACCRVTVDPDCLREAHVDADRCVYENEVCCWPEEPVSIEEAVTIALANNLDLRVRAEESFIQQEVATRDLYGMLPRYRWNFDNSSRNPFLGSSSQSLISALDPAPPSVGSHSHSFRSDVQLSWSAVDFALAFLGMRKSANTVWLRCLEYERAAQRLSFDVIQKYWDVLVLREAAHRTQEYIARAEVFVDAMQELIEQEILSPVSGGRLQDQVLSDEIRLRHFKKLYERSLAELKEMMGLPPHYPLELVPLVEELPEFSPCDPCSLFEVALQNRPELYFHDTEEVIVQDDINRALIQLLPDAEFTGGIFYDSNPFLLHKIWTQVAMRAAIKLFDMPAYVQEAHVNRARKEQVRMKRGVMAAAVMSQVYLGCSMYKESIDEYAITSKVHRMKKRLWEAYIMEAEEGIQHQAAALEAEGKYINARIDMLKNLAEVRINLAQINLAIGIPGNSPFPALETVGEEETCSAS